MTQEDKELLLKDLCARLPYGVKVCIMLPNHREKIFEPHIGDLKEITKIGGYLVNSKGIEYKSFNLDIKPYLRPMSSMTKEEKKEFENLLEGIVDGVERWDKPDLCEDYDWLNAHHFDYRGLIEKGLALEAPEDMYKNN